MDDLRADAPARGRCFASAAARARKSGGLFRHMMLRHSSVEEGSRVEATRASRFEWLKN